MASASSDMNLWLLAFGLLCILGRKPAGRAMRDRMISDYGRFIREKIGPDKEIPARGYELFYLGLGILFTLFGLAGLLGLISYG